MKKILTLSALKMFLLSLVLFTTGCQVNVYDDPPGPPPCGTGTYGLDGLSFVSLDYTNIEPTYIWGNNNSIPNYFAYGQFYQSYAGNFDLYYEGVFTDGCCVKEYYWDVNYDLWYHRGSAGGPCGQPGVNGADSFLSIWMDPLGPGIDRVNKTGDTTFEVLERTDDQIVVLQKQGDFTLKLTYKKLTESKKDQLDPTNIKKAIVK
ncbi:MAG: hypothetical protein H6581_20220 [Bacteroidia bacterium]|nr:hypothetical protein [Bacteroidia bacterium]